jgi:O-antigen/teichoic acid export membrane protein
MEDVLNLSPEEEASTRPSPTSSDRTILTAAKGSGIIFFGTLFEYTGRFALGILLARMMGAEQYGLYSLADSSTYMLIGIALLGLDTGLVYFASIFASRRDEADLWGIVQIGLGLPFLLSLLGGISLFAFSDSLAQAIFHETSLAPILRIAAFAIPCGAVASAAVSVTRGLKQMHYKVIAQDIVQTLIKLLLVALLAITGLTAIKAMVAYSVAMGVACLLLIYFVFRLLPPYQRAPISTRRSVKQMLGYSLPVYLTQLLFLFGPNLRTLLLGALNTVTAVGIFSVAARINMIGAAFYNSVAVMSMPLVSELHSKNERGQLGNLYRTITKWTLTFNIPIFLLILTFSKPILSIFGPTFVIGSLGLIILACGELVNAATGISGSMVTMTGNTWLNAVNSIITLVLTLSLSIQLIPGFGMIGAALATAMGVIVINIIQVGEVFVLYRLLPYDRSFFKPVFAGCVSMLTTYAAMQRIFTGNGLISITINASILVTTYISTILLLGLSREDQMILDRLYDRLNRVVFRRKGAQ